MIISKNYNSNITQDLFVWGSKQLPSTEKCFQIAFKIALIVLAIGVASLILKSRQPVILRKPKKDDAEKARIKGSSLRELINNPDFRADRNWKEKAVKLYRQNYFQEPRLELARLEGSGILTNDTNRIIDNVLSSIKTSPNFRFEKSIWSKTMFSRALEIKNIFEDTHHIVTHGQLTDGFIISVLLKEIMKRKNPEKDYRFFKFLRDMRSFQEPNGFIDSVENIAGSISSKILPKSFKNWINSTKLVKFSKKSLKSLKTKHPINVKEFLSKNPNIHDHNPKIRKVLLSVSGFFTDTTQVESALYFLMNNYNILTINDKSHIKNIVHEILKSVFPNTPPIVLEECISELIQAIPKGNFYCGNFFVLCVPKTISTDILYRSHAFGAKCLCHPDEFNWQILDKAQRGVLDETTRCKLRSYPIPQWRIYLPLLENSEKINTPEERIYTFRLSPIPKYDRNQFKAHVRQVLERLSPTELPSPKN